MVLKLTPDGLRKNINPQSICCKSRFGKIKNGLIYIYHPSSQIIRDVF